MNTTSLRHPIGGTSNKICSGILHNGSEFFLLIGAVEVDPDATEFATPTTGLRVRLGLRRRNAPLAFSLAYPAVCSRLPRSRSRETSLIREAERSAADRLLLGSRPPSRVETVSRRVVERVLSDPFASTVIDVGSISASVGAASGPRRRVLAAGAIRSCRSPTT